VAEPDELGRVRLETGDTPGWSALLEAQEVALHEANRGSRVELPSAVSRKVVIRVDTDELDKVHLPEEKTIVNDAGRFAVTVDSSDESTTLMREVSLTGYSYGPEDWPNLRELLIADDHEANRVLLLKKVGEDE
jgi:hypothetical protein